MEFTNSMINQFFAGIREAPYLTVIQGVIPEIFYRESRSGGVASIFSPQFAISSVPYCLLQIGDRELRTVD